MGAATDLGQRVGEVTDRLGAELRKEPVLLDPAQHRDIGQRFAAEAGQRIGEQPRQQGDHVAARSNTHRVPPPSESGRRECTITVTPACGQRYDAPPKLFRGSLPV